jgi:FMN phosphatase YigB (HAD superfamily)
MKIFIDFDDSLFNTKKFVSELIKVFANCGVSQENFFKNYYDYPKKTSKGLRKYDPIQQISFLSKKKGVDGKKLKRDIKRLVLDASEFVFDDTINFLKCFKRNSLILLSFAKTNFQCDKIKYSGLTDYFSKVIVSDKIKAKEVAKAIGNKKSLIFFIDDRTDQIGPVKDIFPSSVTFLLKRKEGRYNNKKTKSVDFEVKNLKEAKKIIKNKIEKGKRRP